MKSCSGRSLIPCLCLCMALLLVSVSASIAGGGGNNKPSVENCLKLGLMDVRCHVCSTGQFIGKVSMQGEYHEQSNTCGARSYQARQACAAAYGREISEVGIFCEYKIGNGKYSAWSPRKDKCKY